MTNTGLSCEEGWARALSPLTMMWHQVEPREGVHDRMTLNTHPELLMTQLMTHVPCLTSNTSTLSASQTLEGNNLEGCAARSGYESMSSGHDPRILGGISFFPTDLSDSPRFKVRDPPCSGLTHWMATTSPRSTISSTSARGGGGRCPLSRQPRDARTPSGHLAPLQEDRWGFITFVYEP